MSDIDKLLYRPLRPGREFDSLIPKTVCKSTFVGSGDTDFSIDEMQKVVEQYAWQTEKVAAKFAKGSLEAQCAAVKDFIFNHFQYKADTDDQMLRSPACSWYCRQEGIDCKSFSILASCLLTNLGISHYIRKIKQPGFAPTEWTHVYVVVPTDQKTADLDNGYYTIDGTLPSDQEPDFTQKSDLPMMRHYALNGIGDDIKSEIKKISFSDITNSFSINNIGDFFKTVVNWARCLDANYPPKQFRDTYGPRIKKYYDELVFDMNVAVQEGDMVEFSAAVNEFIGNSKLFPLATQNNLKYGWVSCTRDTINLQRQFFETFRDKGIPALNAWLDKYFDRVPGKNSISFSNEGIEQKYGFKHTNSNPWTVVTQPDDMYYPKPTATAIPAFVMNNDLLNIKKPFDPVQFLSGLSTIIASFTPQTANPVNPATGQPYGNLNNQPLPPQNAGIGTVGTIALALGVGWMLQTLLSGGNGPKPTGGAARGGRKPIKKVTV